VEGARASTFFLQRQRSSVSEAPSTSLRVVPLPRFAGADKAIPFSRCTFASELCLHASRKPFPNPPSKKGGRRSADKRIHQSPPRRRKTKPASVCGAHRRSSPATRGIQSGGTLAFRRSTAIMRRGPDLDSAPGRASWNHRIQTGGPSPAPVQRAPRGPARAGRDDAQSRPDAQCMAALPGTALVPLSKVPSRKVPPRTRWVRM